MNSKEIHITSQNKNLFLTIILEVIVEDLRKILLIRSNLKFANSTDENLEFYLMSEEEKESFTFNIQPNEFVYIPFDKTGYKLSFRYASEKNIYSAIIELKKALQ